MANRIMWVTGGDAVLTDAQVEAINKIRVRWGMCDTVEVIPMLASDGAVIVNTGTMFLAVETDGYTHS